jgi:hypothetical protein
MQGQDLKIQLKFNFIFCISFEIHGYISIYWFKFNYNNIKYNLTLSLWLYFFKC